MTKLATILVKGLNFTAVTKVVSTWLHTQVITPSSQVHTSTQAQQSMMSFSPVLWVMWGGPKQRTPGRWRWWHGQHWLYHNPKHNGYFALPCKQGPHTQTHSTTTVQLRIKIYYIVNVRIMSIDAWNTSIISLQPLSEEDLRLPLLEPLKMCFIFIMKALLVLLMLHSPINHSMLRCWLTSILLLVLHDSLN